MSKKHYVIIDDTFIHSINPIEKRFMAVCGRKLKVGRRTRDVSKVTCKQCLETELVQMLIAQKVAERMKPSVGEFVIAWGQELGFDE